MGLLNSPTSETYQTWARGLYDLNEQQIKVGLVKARDFTGYFNLPSFRELCRIGPEDLGLPDVRSAYKECFAGGWIPDREWSHPIVYHAAMETGSYEMQNMPADKLYPLFKYTYDQLVKRVISGEHFEAPVVKAIAKKSEVPLTPEQEEERRRKNEEGMKKLMALLDA